MPQKKNPDVAELARAKSGRLHGNLAGLLTLLKGLPTGYNRDLQEEKTLLFDTMDTLKLTLPALAGALRSTVFNAEAIAGARDIGLLATDLADTLVRAGVPFRQSHEIVGGLVLEAERRGIRLSELPEGVFRAANEAFPKALAEVFDWKGRSRRGTFLAAPAGGPCSSRWTWLRPNWGGVESEGSLEGR